MIFQDLDRHANSYAAVVHLLTQIRALKVVASHGLGGQRVKAACSNNDAQKWGYCITYHTLSARVYSGACECNVSAGSPRAYIRCLSSKMLISCDCSPDNPHWKC